MQRLIHLTHPLIGFGSLPTCIAVFRIFVCCRKDSTNRSEAATGNQGMCFSEQDKIYSQLLKLAKSSSQLWCEGVCPCSLKHHKQSTGSTSIVIRDLSNSDDDARPAKAQKTLKPKKICNGRSSEPRVQSSHGILTTV